MKHKDLDKRIENKLPMLFVNDTLIENNSYRNGRYRMQQFKKRDPEHYNALLTNARQIVVDFDVASRKIVKKADEHMKKFYSSNRALASACTSLSIFYVAVLTIVVIRVIELAA